MWVSHSLSFSLLLTFTDTGKGLEEQCKCDSVLPCFSLVVDEVMGLVFVTHIFPASIFTSNGFFFLSAFHVYCAVDSVLEKLVVTVIVAMICTLY